MGRLNAEIEAQKCLLKLSECVKDNEEYIKALTIVTLYIVDIERQNMEMQLRSDMTKSKTYSKIIELLKKSLTE